MDPENTFFTRRTAQLMRLDYVCLLALSLCAMVAQWSELELWHFVAAIAWQDLLGYYPAAAVYYWPRPSGTVRRLPRAFYVVYNLTHGVPLNLAVLSVWWAANSGWEPAMLAIPIHLCIDRGVFGRYYKSFCIAFEPVRHDLFREFSRQLDERPVWGEGGQEPARMARPLVEVRAPSPQDG